MTSGADGGGKAYHPRRARGAQLHELAGRRWRNSNPSHPPIWRPPKAEKAKRLIIMGIASGCVPASGKRVRAPLPTMNSSNSFFFGRFRDAM
jgi:hypothetical protein